MAVRKRTGRTIAPSVRQTKVAIYIRVSTVHQVDKDSILCREKILSHIVSSFLALTTIMKSLKMPDIPEKILTGRLSRI